MERLKVLFITAWYPTKANPVLGVFVQEHAKAVRVYNDVTVLHCAGTDPTLKTLWRLEREGNESLTQGITTYRVWHRPLPIPKTSYLIYVWSAFRAFQRIASQGLRWDIIHAHVFEAALPAVLIGKFYCIPVVVTEHWTLFPQKKLTRFSLCKASTAFRAARLVMPVSRSLQQAIEDYGINAHFHIVPNVVDIHLFYPNSLPQARKESIKRLLFVGLFDPSHKKGMPNLLQALAQLRQQRDDWHLDIVGDGPPRGEYEQLARDLGLAHKVTFHGRKAKPQIADFMRQAHLFVLPSIWENLPCVVIEAMASGLPILSTLTGGIPELVDEEVGILVPHSDALKLTAALAHMIESLDKYDRNQIAQKAHRYSPESIGVLIDSLYRPCIQR